MTDVQLYFAIGIPTFTVLCSLMIGIFQLNHAVNQINLRFTSLESRFAAGESRLGSLENRLDARMSVIESDLKTLVRLMGDLNTRIARLEERSVR